MQLLICLGPSGISFLHFFVYYTPLSVKLLAVDIVMLNCRFTRILTSIHCIARTSRILVSELRPAFVLFSFSFGVLIPFSRPIHFRGNGELFLARRSLGGLWAEVTN